MEVYFVTGFCRDGFNFYVYILENYNSTEYFNLLLHCSVYQQCIRIILVTFLSSDNPLPSLSHFFLTNSTLYFCSHVESIEQIHVTISFNKCSILYLYCNHTFQWLQYLISVCIWDCYIIKHIACTPRLCGVWWFLMWHVCDSRIVRLLVIFEFCTLALLKCCSAYFFFAYSR